MEKFGQKGAQCLHSGYQSGRQMPIRMLQQPSFRPCRQPLRVQAFAAKPGVPQGPKKGRSLDLGGAAKEEANQDAGLSRPAPRPPPRSQAEKLGQRPQGPRQSGSGSGRPQGGQQQQQDRPSQNRPQGQRPQGQRPTGQRPAGQRPGGQKPPFSRPPQARPSKRDITKQGAPADPDAPPMNQEIRCPEVRVIDNRKEPLGVMATEKALTMALEQDVDLIMINPQAAPPLVRLVPYSKLKFEQAKKDKDQRKKQRENRSDLKELRFRPNTEEHDYNVRLKNAKKHLSKGDKVKLTMRFRGREMDFKALGRDMFSRFVNDLGDEAAIQKDTSVQGNQMTLIVGPKQK